MSKKNLEYNSNPNLKASGVPHAFTEHQITEYIKCANDPVYFAETYIKIVSLDHGEQTIELYDFQKEMLHKYRDNRFCIVKASRQVGKSLTTCAFVLWSVIFQEHYSAAILANKIDTAMEILGKLQFAYEQLPKWLQQGVLSWNKKSIELENGSRIKATTTSSSSARGGTYNLILLEEFAFVDNAMADQFISSVFPTISSGKTTKLFIVSTPNGMNHFYKFWTEAHLKGKEWNRFVPIEAHWSQVPGRDQEWYETQIRLMGEAKFNQEFGGDFVGTSNSLISPKLIETMHWKKPVKEEDGVKIYDTPVSNSIYFLTVDIAEGIGEDYSTFSVFEVNTKENIPYKQVATFRNRDISDLELPTVIEKVANYYNEAWILCEVNFGDKVPYILYNDIGYENLLCTQANGRAGQTLSIGLPKQRGKLGFRTASSSKRRGCDTLKVLLEEGRLVLQDFNTIEELTQFAKYKTSFKANVGYHDDMVATLIIFSWMITDPLFTNLTNIDTRKRILKKQEEDNHNPLPDWHSGENFDDIYVDRDGTAWVVEQIPWKPF